MNTDSFLDLTSTESRILKLIKAFTKQYGESQCSTRWIADKLGISFSHTRRCLKKLYESGLLMRVLRDGRTTVYRVVDWVLNQAKKALRKSWEMAKDCVHKSVNNHEVTKGYEQENEQGMSRVERTPPHIISSMNSMNENEYDNGGLDSVHKNEREEETGKAQREQSRAWVVKEVGSISYYFDRHSFSLLLSMGWSSIVEVIQKLKVMIQKNGGFLKNPSGALVSICKSVSQAKRVKTLTEEKMPENLNKDEIEVLKNLQVVEEHRLQCDYLPDGYWYSRDKAWRFHVLDHVIVFRDMMRDEVYKADATSDCFRETLNTIWSRINGLKKGMM